MRKSKYIDMSLLDPTLKSLLEVSLKILPVPYSVITSGVNNLGVDYVVVTTEGIHYNEIYRWDAGAWHLIGADDRNISKHISNTTVHVTQTDKDKWNASDITVGTVQPTNSSIWFKTL